MTSQEALSYIRDNTSIVKTSGFNPMGALKNVFTSVAKSVAGKASPTAASAAAATVAKNTSPSAPVAGKMDKFVNTIFRGNTGAVEDVNKRMIQEGAHAARSAHWKQQGGGSWYDKVLGRSKPPSMNKQQVKKNISESAQHIDGKGGYWTRVKNNAIEDIKHPIRNVQRYLYEMGHKYIPPSGDGIGGLIGRNGQMIDAGQIVRKTPGEIGMSVAGATALPLVFSSMSWNDPELSAGGKVGITAANFAVPMFSRRMIPSMVAYSGIDKMLRKKQPSTPQMVQR